MIRVTEHTRRKAGGKCNFCPLPIKSGERYRQLVQVGETDIWEDSFGRYMAHTHCADTSALAEGWQPTEARRRAEAVELARNTKIVADWNATHGPNEVRVRYWPWTRESDPDGAVGVTSGPAWLSPSGRPTVHIQGCSTMALSHVDAISWASGEVM